MGPSVSELPLLWTAVAAYGASTLAASTGSLRARAARHAHDPYVLVFLMCGLVALAVALAIRWQRVGHGPFLSLFEVLLSNLFSLGLIYALAYWLFPVLRCGARFALPVLLALGLWALGTPTQSTALPATYDNPWLWVHVIAGKLFLGVLLVSSGCAVAIIHRAAADLDRSSMETALWRTISVAFVFDTLMLVAGAAWARDAWGKPWSWDPLETWSLVIWLLLGMLLHQRLRSGLPTRLGAACAIAVFALALVTFLGIPFLSIGAHKGVM